MSAPCTCGTKPNGGHLVTCPAVAAPEVVSMPRLGVEAVRKIVDEGWTLNNSCAQTLCSEIASQSEQIARLTRERDRAREFVEWAMRDGSWMGYDIDGGDAQDKAEELGLIVEVPASPEVRAKHDCDTMYDLAWLASLPSTPER